MGSDVEVPAESRFVRDGHGWSPVLTLPLDLPSRTPAMHRLRRHRGALPVIAKSVLRTQLQTRRRKKGRARFVSRFIVGGFRSFYDFPLLTLSAIDKRPKELYLGSCGLLCCGLPRTDFAAAASRVRPRTSQSRVALSCAELRTCDCEV